ncbi:MAG: hypothetical protein IJ571_06085 [Ruminococcus sp.]|nr:hypothetical protein [Ruminococcus sp.]
MTDIRKNPDGSISIDGITLSQKQAEDFKNYFKNELLKEEALEYIARYVLLETEGSQGDKTKLYNLISENESLMNAITAEFEDNYDAAKTFNEDIRERSFDKAIHEFIDFNDEMKQLRKEQ